MFNSPVVTPAHEVLGLSPSLRLRFARISENVSLLALYICATTHGSISSSCQLGSFLWASPLFIYFRSMFGLSRSCCRCPEQTNLVRSRRTSVTSLGHQRGPRGFWEWPKFFKLCPILLNNVQHSFPEGEKNFPKGTWRPLFIGLSKISLVFVRSRFSRVRPLEPELPHATKYFLKHNSYWTKCFLEQWIRIGPPPASLMWK